MGGWKGSEVGGEEGRGEAEGRRVLLRPEPAVPEELVEGAAGTRSRWVERALPPRAGADDYGPPPAPS